MNIRKLSASIGLIVLMAGSSLAQPNPALGRGNELFKQEKYELAIKEYQQVPFNNEGDYARALYNIGVCYYELWRTAEAISFYQHAVAIKRGNYPIASFALGVALEDENRLSEAKAAYRLTIQASKGKNGPAIYRLGLVFAREGDLENAAYLFRSAHARTGEHVPASHNNLGVMLAQMGKLGEAEVEFQTALTLSNGKFDDADHNLKLCRSLRSTADTRNQPLASKFRMNFQ